MQAKLPTPLDCGIVKHKGNDVPLDGFDPCMFGCAESERMKCFYA